MEKYEQQIVELPPHQTSGIKVKEIVSGTSVICSEDNYHIVLLEDNIKTLYTGSDKNSPGLYSLIFLEPGKPLHLVSPVQKHMGWRISIPPRVFHEICTDLFHENHAHGFFSSGQQPRIVISAKTGSRLSSVVEFSAELLQGGLPDSEMAALSLLKTLFIFCRGSKVKSHPDEGNGRHTRVVRLFRQHISLNLPEHHHVAWYADKLNVTPKYLNRIVKETTGMTAKSLILEQLMAHACRELKLSNLSVKEIAIKLGFSEPEHFSNFFKKNAGCSPTEFRQN